MKRFERVDGSNSLKTNFENVLSCDLGPSPRAFKKENIERERIVVFIGISLLLSLIAN